MRNKVGIAIHISIESSFQGLLPPIIKFKFYERDTLQSSKEDPANERLCNSRLSGRF